MLVLGTQHNLIFVKYFKVDQFGCSCVFKIYFLIIEITESYYRNNLETSP